jgi:hypothetical protein
MSSALEKSIDRAISLLQTPKDYEKYFSIKLSPVPDLRCCCFHCVPRTWIEVNRHIRPYGPIKDEGDALIGQNDSRFVLECHESGPEIIAYLALGTASLTLLKSIVDLVIVIVNGLSGETKKPPASIKISRKQIIKGEISQEDLIEFDIPVSKNTMKQIKDRFKRVLNDMD